MTSGLVLRGRDRGADGRPRFATRFVSAAGVVLCAAGLMLIAACAGPGADGEGAAVDQAAEVYTPERLRLLHQRGLKARDREIYDVALSYFVEASDGGYGPASVAAGKIYATDNPGLPRNDLEASRRYHLAVDQGSGYVAELPLGALYLEGRGVESDPAEAERWFRRGALTIADLQGVVKEGEEARSEGGADQLVANLFAPHPVPEAFDDALAWARELETWDGALLFKVSEQYRTGDGTLADTVLAEDLLSRAAARDHPEAAYRIARNKLDGSDGERDEAAGRDLLWRAAQGDLVVAQKELGLLYADAEDDPLDLQRAYYWLIRAKRNGAEVADEIDDVAGSLSEEERRDVLQTLEAGQAYLP